MIYHKYIFPNTVQNIRRIIYKHSSNKNKNNYGKLYDY